MPTEQLLYWSGMTDTEQSTTSDSNEEDCYNHGKIALAKNLKN